MSLGSPSFVLRLPGSVEAGRAHRPQARPEGPEAQTAQPPYSAVSPAPSAGSTFPWGSCQSPCSKSLEKPCDGLVNMILRHKDTQPVCKGSPHSSRGTAATKVSLPPASPAPPPHEYIVGGWTPWEAMGGVFSDRFIKQLSSEESEVPSSFIHHHSFAQNLWGSYYVLSTPRRRGYR